MRKQILLILLTGIILLLTASLYAQSGSRYALEAMEYFQRGEYRNAIEQYKLADRAADGQVPAYRFWLGRLYIAENDTLNARLWLNRYLDSGEERNRTEYRTTLGFWIDRPRSSIPSRFPGSPLFLSWNSDTGAIMSPDINYLYFTSLRPSSYECEYLAGREVIFRLGRPK
jgi:tetratricopeptide (TPR) repeat protein